MLGTNRASYAMAHFHNAFLQGAGILQPEKVARMNSVKHAVNKLGQLLPGGGSVSHDQVWVKSNRCRRCHGSGVIRAPCPACKGTGRRAAVSPR